MYFGITEQLGSLYPSLRTLNLSTFQKSMPLKEKGLVTTDGSVGMPSSPLLCLTDRKYSCCW